MGVAVVVLATACGSSDEESGGAGGQAGTGGSGATGATSGSGGSGNGTAPEWNGATNVTAKEGLNLTVPIDVSDADGDDVTVTVDAAMGATATVADDGSSLTVAAGYGVDSASVDLMLADGTGKTTTVTLSVKIDRLMWGESDTWVNSPTLPEAREHGAWIVDTAKDRAILVGGSGYDPYLEVLDDVWIYDLKTREFTSATTSGDVPGPAGSRRVAQGDGTVAYLFGGYGDNQSNLDELYKVDFSADEIAFTKVEQEGQKARALHVFAGDAKLERFIAFGGIGDGLVGGSAILDDTQVMMFEGGKAVWKTVMVPKSPSARYGAFVGVDPEHSRAYVYSGAQGTANIDPAEDTWMIDFAADPVAWKKIADGAKDNVPPGRRNGMTVFDPTGPRMFVTGGTADAMSTSPGLFVLDLREDGAWSELEIAMGPPLRSSGFGFFDPTSGQSFFSFGNSSSAAYRDVTPLGY